MRRVEQAITISTGAITTHIARPAMFGMMATVALLVFYFGILSLVSGWDFAISQFAAFWYFVLPLAIGFGLQVALYVCLRQITTHDQCGKVVATSGTTSTAAMISCCAHYLTNILPVIGTAGIISMIAQYQIEFFWVGLAFNAAGLAYIASKVIAARAHMREMRA
jgi:P-type Cu+ transporter